MTEREFKEIVDRFKATGLNVDTYPCNWLINMTDIDGIVQSYYSSTGTAIFRDSGHSRTQKKKTIRNMSEERFRNICMSGEALTNFKRGEW